MRSWPFAYPWVRKKKTRHAKSRGYAKRGYAMFRKRWKHGCTMLLTSRVTSVPAWGWRWPLGQLNHLHQHLRNTPQRFRPALLNPALAAKLNCEASFYSAAPHVRLTRRGTVALATSALVHQLLRRHHVNRDLPRGPM